MVWCMFLQFEMINVSIPYFVDSNKRPAPKAEETLPTKKLKNFYALTSDEVEENSQLQKELIGHFVENVSVPGGDKHVKKIKSLIAENFSKIDESPSEYEAVLKDVYKHVLKSLSNKSFDPVVPQEVLQVVGLLPIEQVCKVQRSFDSSGFRDSCFMQCIYFVIEDCEKLWNFHQIFGSYLAC